MNTVAYNPSSIFLFDTTCDEIRAKISSLKNSATVKDSNIYKQNELILSPILCDLINNCFVSGKFPEQLKISRIIPIYKAGNPHQTTNYRPISILPVLSKIFESLFCDRINSFIYRHNIIHENQFGFQRNSSALSAATTLVDLLQRHLDIISGTIACCVFIDLKKAFDTVPHELLLETLNKYEIRGNANRILHEYLKNRKQYVDLTDKQSDVIINDNDFALPQGSNLGPLLFILYINGIFDLELYGKLILFADDAVLVFFETDLTLLQLKIQQDLDKIFNWLTSKKLTLNAEKTTYMLVHPNETVDSNQTQFKLKINDNSISRVSSFKYLGLTLQDNLKWDKHVDSVCKKIMGIACVVKRMGSKVNFNTKLSLYYAMVNSQLGYLSPVWSTAATNCNKNRLQIAQNQAIRSIFYYEYNTLEMSTTQIMTKYSILNVQQLFRQNEMLMIFKITKNLFKSNYKINTVSIHHYPTRAAMIPRPSAFRTNVGKNSIFRSCTKTFYDMQLNLLSNLSVHSFKKKTEKEFD